MRRSGAPKKSEWDWEKHMTDAEMRRLSALFLEGDSLRERLEAIHSEEDALCQKAVARAKAANDRKKPFIL